MSVDDVWGAETWHMNQSVLHVESGSATQDKNSILTKQRKKWEEAHRVSVMCRILHKLLIQVLISSVPIALLALFSLFWLLQIGNLKSWVALAAFSSKKKKKKAIQDQKLTLE